MQPKILLVTSFYPEFLSDLYQAEPELSAMPYKEQHKRLFDTGFGVGDAYSANLRLLGCEAIDIVCDADVMQQAWADEHGLTQSGNIHDRRRQILAAQVEAFRPDVVYVFEWSPLGDEFLHAMKRKVALRVGQIASPIPENRTFSGYDLMLSSWPPIVDHFAATGMTSAYFRLGFDERVWERIGQQPRRFDVTFVGGFAPSHTARVPWLEALLGEVDIDIFGYGLDRVPSNSPIRDHFRGPAWGHRMFEILGQSKITLHLNATINVPGQASDDYACAMRFYEASGMGTCLLTENKSNLSDLLTPGTEICAYENMDQAIEIIRHYLTHDTERETIAQAGQARTLREHTYRARMSELLEILTRQLAARSSR